ncbi:MAG: carbon starvation CstA family protein, partial [Steroidobacteraceae bacterium]
VQDLLGRAWAPLGDTKLAASNLLATVLCVSAWGYFLYQGVVDPLGGIHTLWQLFGIGNQMLAGIALLLCTTVLIKMKRERYAWVTILPTSWLLVTTLTAGLQKIIHADPKIGFLAQGHRFSDALARGEVLAPAKTLADMHRIAFNNNRDAAVAGVFTTLVVALAFFTLRACLRALREPRPTAVEIPAALAPAELRA